MSVRTVCYVEVNGIYVEPAALGQSFERRYLGNRFVLSFPANNSDRTFVAAVPNVTLLGSLAVQRDSVLGTIEYQEVLTIRTTIETNGNDVLIRDASKNAAHRTPAQVWIERHQRWSQRVLSDALNVLRVQSGQYWLGKDLDRLRTLRTDFYDADGETLTVTPGTWRSGTSRFLRPGQIASKSTIGAALAQGQRKQPLAETLVADAWIAHLRREHREALLLAAIAAETAVRHTLMSVATDDQQPLVTLLLRNAREYPMAAVSLFDKAMFAVISRSLRREARHVYSRVVKLFEDRNKVAHSTADVEWSAIPRHLRAATEAVAWLRMIEREGRQSS